MRITKTELACIGILLVVFCVSVYFYSQMPERIATHWDLRGRVNGYMPKSLGLFGMPVILSVFVVSLIIVPRVVSVSANIEGFRRFFGGLVILISVFMLLAQYQMILWNLGIEIHPALFVLPMILALVIWMIFWFCRACRRR